MLTGALLAAVFVPMLVEARRAAFNERGQRARGGIEPAGDVYRIMTVVYPLAFLAMIAEGFLRGAPSLLPLAAGAIVFVAGKALKWWAIAALGPAWTFRVLVVPGSRRVTSGPYAFLRHPNYIAVAAELIGVALMSGARIAGPVSTLVFAALMAVRARVETAALDAILPPA